MDNHDQQDCANDREDQLTYQAKLSDIEQIERASDKIGNQRANYSEQEIAHDPKAAATHRTTGKASRDSTGDHL